MYKSVTLVRQKASCINKQIDKIYSTSSPYICQGKKSLSWDPQSKISSQGSPYMLYKSFKPFHKLKYWVHFYININITSKSLVKKFHFLTKKSRYIVSQQDLQKKGF